MPRFASWRWSKIKRFRWRACRSPCALIESNLRMAGERSSTIKPGRPQDSLAGGASTRTALPLYSLLDPKIQGIAFAELPASDPVQFIALGEDLSLAKGDKIP